jgi:hypothetical protein
MFGSVYRLFYGFLDRQKGRHLLFAVALQRIDQPIDQAEPQPNADKQHQNEAA